MKSFLITILLFLNINSFGQILIKPQLKEEVEIAFKNYPNSDRFKILDTSDICSGVVLITQIELDTLNKNKYRPKPLEIVSGDLEFDSLRNSYKFIEKKVSEDKKDTLACMGYCYFSNDSLKIIVSLGLFSEDEFSISIKNQEAEVKFSLYNYENKTLRKTIKSKSSNSIKINSIIKNFILSNYPKKAGDTFYAKATLISDDFFVEDADFKGGFINIRPTIDFIFKLRVIILPK